MTKIQNALMMASETRDLKIGAGIIDQVAALFAAQFADSKAIVVADRNTYKVAGEAVMQCLQDAKITCLPAFVFADENLYAEYGYVEKLIENFGQHDAIAIAVGSGTINDLVKLASSEVGRRYMCVSTAASMDGYTAFGASITANGAKQTFNCPAPKACLVDTEIVAKAPREMTAAGYADLFAKITAGADWILADRLHVEAIDKRSWDIVQNGLQEALVNPVGVSQGDVGAVEMLIEGLMLGGFAMQAHKSSRPASGAEHQLSHLWNMEHHTNNGEPVSHGFQVAIGTLAISALYEEIFKTPLQDLDVEACCKVWPSADELAKEAREMFKDTDFPEIGYEETKAKYVSKEELAVHLNLLKNNWLSIKEDLQGQLLPFDYIQRCLQQAGAPTKPEDIGISRQQLRQAYVRSQYIRSRFTVLDLAVWTNMLDVWLDRLFGKGGVWQE